MVEWNVLIAVISSRVQFASINGLLEGRMSSVVDWGNSLVNARSAEGVFGINMVVSFVYVQVYEKDKPPRSYSHKPQFVVTMPVKRLVITSVSWCLQDLSLNQGKAVEQQTARMITPTALGDIWDEAEGKDGQEGRNGRKSHA